MWTVAIRWSVFVEATGSTSNDRFVRKAIWYEDRAQAEDRRHWHRPRRATIVYSCMIRGVEKPISLFDVAKAKLKAGVLGLNYGLMFVPEVDPPRGSFI
jgi:hypothetical protein